jgi:hypothetical protein
MVFDHIGFLFAESVNYRDILFSKCLLPEVVFFRPEKL